MLNLLKFLDDRIGEASTWSAISALLIALHINVDPGLWHAITLWGGGASGVLGILIAEASSGKTGTQAMQDILKALADRTNKTPPA